MNRFFALLSALVICAGGASSAIAGVNSFADRSDVVASFATVGAGISLESCLVGEAAPAPAPAEAQGEPVYRAGGRLVRRIK